MCVFVCEIRTYLQIDFFSILVLFLHSFYVLVFLEMFLLLHVKFIVFLLLTDRKKGSIYINIFVQHLLQSAINNVYKYFRIFSNFFFPLFL